MQHLKKFTIFLLIFTFILGIFPGFIDAPASSVSAASKITVKYKYKGKNKVFRGTSRKVLYNSKAVSLKKTPIIVIGGYHMAPYYETFVKGSLKAKRSYNSKKKTLVLTANGHTIKFTAESKTAYVDGKKKKLPAAPKMITYRSSKLTRFMVPLKETASYLGLTYTWNKKNSTIQLRCPAKPSDINSAASSAANTESTTRQETTTTATHTDSNTSSIEVPEEDEPTDFDYTMFLKRPDDVSQGTITCEDDYKNKRLKIIMPGNQKDFYKSNKPSLASGVTFSCKYSSSSHKTTLYFKTKKINGFKVQEDSRFIYIKHGTPAKMFKNVIVLDAGHGGSDTGATGNGYKEKNMTLSIVKAAKTYFDNNGDYKVYYTRLTDTYPSLSDRYKLANEVNADLFISVHINSAGKTATGTETLYNPDRNKKSSAGLTCYKLASYTHKYIKAATGFTNRGLKKRCSRLGNGLAVLSHNNGPATLTEIGFISNPSEAKKMNKNLSSYGKAVYDSVVYTASQYPTHR